MFHEEDPFMKAMRHIDDQLDTIVDKKLDEKLDGIIEDKLKTLENKYLAQVVKMALKIDDKKGEK